jgi:hypothetical protein
MGAHSVLLAVNTSLALIGRSVRGSESFLEQRGSASAVFGWTLLTDIYADTVP